MAGTVVNYLVQTSGKDDAALASKEILSDYKPKAGYWVRLKSNQDQSLYTSTAVTDSTGKFSILAVPNGIYKVQISLVNPTPSGVDWQIIDGNFTVGDISGSIPAANILPGVFDPALVASNPPDRVGSGSAPGQIFSSDVWLGEPNGSDDTVAIDAAYAAATNIGGSGRMGRLMFRAGTYNYNGNGLNGTRYNIQGAGATGTTINIAVGKYLMIPAGALIQLQTEGIRFSGGAGAFRHTGTGVNVLQQSLFRDCVFAGYTVCAIGSLSVDFPYWFIENCQFDGTTASSIGFALAGDGSGGHISGCQFMRNRYHIKLGLGGLAFKLRDNDLVRFDAYAGTPRTDVWITPNVVAQLTGCLMEGNKFGNENINGADYRVLYADEDTATGADFLQRSHKATTSTGIINGHIIIANKISGIAAAPPPFIYSTADDVRNLCVEANDFDGTAPNYVVQFLNANAGDRTSSTSILGHNGMTDIGAIQPLASNRPGFAKTADPQGEFLDSGDAIHSYPGDGDDPEYVPLAVTAMSAWTAANGATITPTQVDSLGGTTAIIAAAGAGGAGNVFANAAASATLGVPMFWELDVKSGGAAPVASIDLRVLDAAGGGVLMFQRILRVPSGWRRFRFLLVPRTATIHVPVVWINTASGTVLLGRSQLYHARAPLKHGFQQRMQTPTEAVLVSGIEPRLGKIVKVTLTAARVVGAPLNRVVGQEYTFVLTQGGAGGFAVTWNAAWKVTWADTGNTVGKQSTISFVDDGTNLNQVGAQSPYV